MRCGAGLRRFEWEIVSAAHHRGLGCLLHPLQALLWINHPQVLDNLEIAGACLGDVHVHSSVMLTGLQLDAYGRLLRSQ